MKLNYSYLVCLSLCVSQMAFAANDIPFMSAANNYQAPQLPTENLASSELDLEFLVEPLDASLAFYQLETQTFIKPAPVFIDGKAYLTYELFVTNVGTEPFKVSRVDVLNGDNLDRTIASFAGQSLLDMIKTFQSSNTDNQSLILRPGIREVLFFMTPLAGKKDVPNKVIHRFVLRSPNSSSADDDNTSDFYMHTTPVDISTAAPLVVGAPLQGNHWLAANGPSNTSINRRSHITNHGMMYFPERFGIDFMQFGNNGKLYKNDTHKNENYFGYGAKVYSVSGGKVVGVQNDVADNTPGTRNYQITLDKLGGNYVLIDMGNKRYAYYAHLMPGSIRVKRGDIIQKGQLLGQVGNSGNSDAPHLRFQITDKPSNLSAQGMPYGFDIFYTEAYKVPNPNADDPLVVFNGKRTMRKGELVHENAVMDFGNNWE